MKKSNHIFSVLNLDIEDMDFSVIAINGCQILEIKKVFHLLEKIKNNHSEFASTFGPKSREEIKQKFLKKGIDIDKINFNQDFKNQFRLYKIISDHLIVES